MTNDEQRPKGEIWIARIRDTWRRPPLTPNQRAAFDERLDERLRGNRRADWLFPASVAATAAILGVVVAYSTLLPGTVTESAESLLAPDPAASAEIANSVSADESLTARDVAEAWIEFGDEAYASEPSSPADAFDASLPDDYAAIENLLLGG